MFRDGLRASWLGMHPAGLNRLAGVDGYPNLPPFLVQTPVLRTPLRPSTKALIIPTRLPRVVPVPQLGALPERK